MIIQNLTNPAAVIQSTQPASETLMNQLRAVAEVDLTKMNAKEKADLKEKCREFESLFVKMMLDTMRKSIERTKNESAALEQGKDIYEEMLYGEYAKEISRSGALGIGDMIFRQLTTPVVSAAEIARRYAQH